MAEEEVNASESAAETIETQTEPQAEVKTEVITDPPRPSILERFQDKFQDEEELASFIENTLSTPKEEVSDLTRRLIALEKENKLDKQTLAFIAKDFDSYDTDNVTQARKLIEEGLRAKNPKWKQERIELELETEYDLSEYEDDPDSKGYKRIKNRIIKDAESYKEFLKAEQDKYGIAAVQPNPEEVKARQLEAQRSMQIITEQIERVASATKEINIKLGEETIPFAIDKQVADKVKAIMKDPKILINSFYDQSKGTYDFERMFNAFAKIELFDKAIQYGSEQAIQRAKKEVVASQSNVTTAKTAPMQTNADEMITLPDGTKMSKARFDEVRKQLRR